MPVNGNKLEVRLGHTFKQESESDTWNVKHNLGREVICDVMVEIDGKKRKILPQDLEYPDNNTLIVKFSRPLKGSVRIS